MGKLLFGLLCFCPYKNQFLYFEKEKKKLYSTTVLFIPLAVTQQYY